jgi:hypothetical protein
MATLRTLGLAAPVDFPATSYDELTQWVAAVGEERLDPWLAFSAAWNAVGYRAIAAEEHASRYVVSITSPKSTMNRFTQDDALFHFAVSSLSAIECFFTAAYCVGSLAHPESFPIVRASDLHFGPVDVANRFRTVSPLERISTLMKSALDDDNFKKLRDLRNVLAHRGTPPRQHYADVSIGFDGRPVVKKGSTIPANLKALPKDWDYSESIDKRLVDEIQGWRRFTLAGLIGALHEYAARSVIVPPASPVGRG